MTKCAACARFLSPKGAAACASCPCMYHRGCVRIADAVAIPKDWVCPECSAKQRKLNSNGTPVKPACGAEVAPAASVSPAASDAPVVSAVTDTPVASGASVNTSPTVSAPPADKDSEVSLLRREFSNYAVEQREFRAEIRASLRSMCERMEDIERRLEAVERKEAETVPHSVEVEKLQQTVVNLQLEINDRDQDMLLSDLDIGHVPEEKGENVIHTFTILAAKLGVTVEPRDIVFAERVGAAGRSGPSADMSGAGSIPRRIVVRLARRQLRDEMLQAARVRRTFTSADVGLPGPSRRIYVNERLTRTNRLLFRRVRDECRSRHWRFAWTKRGRVYARESDGKQAFCIRSDADFDRVFGAIHV